MIILGLDFLGIISENEFKTALKIWIGILVASVVFAIGVGIFALIMLIHG